jgi:hypothetical protein
MYCTLLQFAARPPTTTSTGALGKYDFMYAKTWFGIDFARCLTYVAKRPGASFSKSISGYRWQRAHYPRAEGLQTQPREANPIPVPAPATRHGQELVPTPATCGHNKPAGTPVPAWHPAKSDRLLNILAKSDGLFNKNIAQITSLEQHMAQITQI